jgi:hypothetical protein
MDADQLRDLLELWERKVGRLSSDQIQALIDWDKTPDDVRAALTASMPASVLEELHRGRAELVEDRGKRSV